MMISPNVICHSQPTFKIVRTVQIFTRFESSLNSRMRDNTDFQIVTNSLSEQAYYLMLFLLREFT